jgi:hypothetical protein
MRQLLRLYLSYMKTVLVVMVWTGVTLAAYGLIRRSGVAETVAVGLVAVTLSLVVAVPLIDLLSPSHVVRRRVATVLAAILAHLQGTQARSGQGRRA